MTAACMVLSAWFLGRKQITCNPETWSCIFSGLLLIFFGSIMGAINRFGVSEFLAVRLSSFGEVIPGKVFGFGYGTFMLSMGFARMLSGIPKIGRQHHDAEGLAPAPFDIRERKCMENELLKQLAAIEACMDGIAILDREEKYLYLNRSHAEIYGYDDHRELVGKTWRIFYSEEEIRRLEQSALPN